MYGLVEARAPYVGKRPRVLLRQNLMPTATGDD